LIDKFTDIGERNNRGSGLNPAPSSSKEAMLPWIFSLPEVGVRTPESIFNKVDLPEPFRPIMPMLSPSATRKLISLRA